MIRKAIIIFQKHIDENYKYESLFKYRLNWDYLTNRFSRFNVRAAEQFPQILRASWNLKLFEIMKINRPSLLN